MPNNPATTDAYWNSNLSPGGDRQVGAVPAMAMLVNVGAPDIAAAWEWFDANVYQIVKASASGFVTNPQFAIRPRI